MLRIFKKPYFISVLVSVILVLTSTFVLLDAFVTPKFLKLPPTNNTPQTNNLKINDKTSDDIIVTEMSCKDSYINISIETRRKHNTNYYIAEIILKDPSLIKTAFAHDAYGRNIKQTTSEIAKSKNAILAINGDFYGFRDSGYVLRNVEEYRNTITYDLTGEDLIITKDGDFEIINEHNTPLSELKDKNVSQVISFGPSLVQNGKSTVNENDEVGKSMISNPRTAIGQIDSLHYIMIVSDGRTSESEGLSLKELSDIFVDLNCKTAYNLDGGGSSTMVFNGKIINKPTTNGKRISEREVSDIVYIGYQ